MVGRIIKLLSLLGVSEIWRSEFWRGADFVAQQKMLPCATKGWVVAQGGWRGVGRKLQGKKCAPLG